MNHIPGPGLFMCIVVVSAVALTMTQQIHLEEKPVLIHGQLSLGVGRSQAPWCEAPTKIPIPFSGYAILRPHIIGQNVVFVADSIHNGSVWSYDLGPDRIPATADDGGVHKISEEYHNNSFYIDAENQSIIFVGANVSGGFEEVYYVHIGPDGIAGTQDDIAGVIDRVDYPTTFVGAPHLGEGTLAWTVSSLRTPGGYDVRFCTTDVWACGNLSGKGFTELRLKSKKPKGPVLGARDKATGLWYWAWSETKGLLDVDIHEAVADESGRVLLERGFLVSTASEMLRDSFTPILFYLYGSQVMMAERLNPTKQRPLLVPPPGEKDTAVDASWKVDSGGDLQVAVVRWYRDQQGWIRSRIVVATPTGKEASIPITSAYDDEEPSVEGDRVVFERWTRPSRTSGRVDGIYWTRCMM